MPKKPELVDLKDKTAIGVVAVFILQKAGELDDRGVQKVAKEKLCLKIHLNNLRWALDALKRRGMAVVSSQQREDGSGIQTWAVAKIDSAGWSGLELVQREDFLPVLMATPNAEEIMKIFADAEEVDDNEKKPRKSRETDIGRYVACEACFECLTLFPGARILDQAEQLFIRRAENGNAPPKGAKLVLPRNLDGNPIVDPDHFRGWFGGNMRQFFDSTNTGAQYLSLAPGHITVRGKTVQIDLPIQRDPRMSVNKGASGTGAGINFHEALRPGSLIKFYFSFPTRGFMTPFEMKCFLFAAGSTAPRWMCPRGKKYGQLLLKKFKVYGSVRIISNALEAAIRAFPKSVQQKNSDMFAKMLKQAEGLTFGSLPDEYMEYVEEQCAGF